MFPFGVDITNILPPVFERDGTTEDTIPCIIASVVQKAHSSSNAIVGEQPRPADFERAKLSILLLFEKAQLSVLFFVIFNPNQGGIQSKFVFIFSRTSCEDLASFEITTNHSLEKHTAFQKNIRDVSVERPTCLDLHKTIL